MLKILVVEDHIDTAKMMRLVLERYGYEVRFATSVAEGLAAADQERFDVCICDFRLPDDNGASLSHQLLTKHNLKSICLTGDVAVMDLESDPASGFAACLTKPLDIEQMLRTIRQVTGGN
jgi:CheY-like chemotaxis protein